MNTGSLFDEVSSQGQTKPQPEPSKGETIRFFYPGSIREDKDRGCFVCGTDHGSSHSLLATVKEKSLAQKVVDMFTHEAAGELPNGGVTLNQPKPDNVQIIIGACEKHGAQLKKLLKVTKADCEINTMHVAEARATKT